MELAGTVSAAEIAGEMGRGVSAVRMKASRLGLPLSVQPPVWCPACAAWRTSLDAQGRCPVCRMKGLADAMEARWRDKAPSDGTPAHYPAPVAKRPPLAVVRAEEAAAVARHRSRYDAAKMRLSRARRAER